MGGAASLRIGEESTAFLAAVLCNLMEQRYQPAARVVRDGSILRVIIEDRSSQVMPKSNAAAFPAHDNHHDATRGVKIDFAYDRSPAPFGQLRQLLPPGVPNDGENPGTAAHHPAR